MLQARLNFDGIAVLDLFAGSGALGLEALSRGADHVTLVESNATAAKVIVANIAAVGLPGAELRHMTDKAFLSSSPTCGYDLVLADPPYAVSAEEISALLGRLTDQWLNHDAIVVIERDAASPATVWPEGWKLLPQRKYGGTRLDIAEL